MGEDKALLKFNGFSSLSSYQYNRLKPYFNNIYLSSKVNKFDFPCEIILDKGEIYSPLIALKTILENIRSPKVFIITVDTPLVSIETINKLIKQSCDYDITVAKTQRLHSLTGVFSKSILNEITEMLNEDIHKIGFLLEKVNTNIITFEDDNEFINLNNPEDYKEALKLVSSLEI